MPSPRSLLNFCLLSLCTCLLLACSGLGQREGQVQAAKRVDFSGSWELDYSQSDNIQAKLSSMVRELRRQAERRAQAGGYQQGGAVLSAGGSGSNSGESIIGLARMAELITSSNLLEIEQDVHRIKVKREENFALRCDFPAAGYNTVETPLGTESCGWNSHQMVFRIMLPEGLSIQHVMTLGPEGQRLNIATTVVSDRVSYPFTLNRVFNRFVPGAIGFSCKMTLTRGRVCTTESQ